MAGYYKTKQERSGVSAASFTISQISARYYNCENNSKEVFAMDKRVLTVILSILAIIIESMGDDE